MTCEIPPSPQRHKRGTPSPKRSFGGSRQLIEAAWARARSLIGRAKKCPGPPEASAKTGSHEGFTRSPSAITNLGSASCRSLRLKRPPRWMTPTRSSGSISKPWPEPPIKTLRLMPLEILGYHQPETPTFTADPGVGERSVDDPTDSHGQMGMLLTLSPVRLRRHSYLYRVNGPPVNG